MRESSRPLAVLSMLVLAAPVWAFGGWFRPRVSYYYAVPVVVTPAPVVPDPCAMPPLSAPILTPPAPPSSTVVPAPGWARPSPAPPSRPAPQPQVEELRQAPPAALPAPPPPLPTPPAAGPVPSNSLSPMVTESRYPPSTGVRAVRRPTDRCSVAFWNLTARPLSLRIDGRGQVVPPGKSVTLELNRQFVWQVEGREPQVERIPVPEVALDVVIRR